MIRRMLRHVITTLSMRDSTVTLLRTYKGASYSAGLVTATPRSRSNVHALRRAREGIASRVSR